MNLNLFTALVGLGLAAVILYLLRRDYMHTSHAVFWFAVAVVAGILGAWPRLIDRVGEWFGISYSPAFLLLIAVIVLTVKALQADSENTRLERDLRTLNQRMAVLEARLDAASPRNPATDATRES
jgi:hypothetical protein